MLSSLYGLVAAFDAVSPTVSVITTSPGDPVTQPIAAPYILAGVVVVIVVAAAAALLITISRKNRRK